LAKYYIRAVYGRGLGRMVFMPWVSAALMYRGAQYGQYLTPKFCTQRPRPPPRSVLMARLSSSARRRHTAQDYGSRHCRQANSDRLSHSRPGAGTIKRDGTGYVFAPVKT
jgi:hypothetical protein